MHLRVTLIILIITITACQTQVKSIDVDKDLISSKKSGYLCLGVDTNIDLEKIEISGAKDITLTKRDLAAGDNIILVPLPSGSYRIKRIYTSKYNYFKGFEKSLWNFEVKSGVISYVGHLKAKIQGFWLFHHRGNFELLNQSSVALVYLENNFPNLLESRSIEYSGPGEDNFFNFIRERGEL